MTGSRVQRLIDKLNSGESVIGTSTLSYSVEMVDILAYAGFDFIFIDQMFTTVGWKQLADMVRAAQAADMVVLARLENDPWYGGDDCGVAARVSRALGIGADGVKLHVFSKNEARWAVAAGTGWHRRPHIVEFSDASHSITEQFKKYEEQRAAGTLIIPTVESKLGISQVDEMLDIPGLRAFGIGMTDTAIMLGHPMDYEHPDVWKFVDHVAAKSKERGIHLACGTGYSFRTCDVIAARVRRMHDHGIGMIFIQTPEFLFQVAMQELMSKVRTALRR